MRISLCYNHAQVVPKPHSQQISSKLQRPVARGNSSDCISKIDHQPSGRMGVLLFFVFGIYTYLSPSVYRSTRKKNDGGVHWDGF